MSYKLSVLYNYYRNRGSSDRQFHTETAAMVIAESLGNEFGIYTPGMEDIPENNRHIPVVTMDIARDRIGYWKRQKQELRARYGKKYNALCENEIAEYQQFLRYCENTDELETRYSAWK